MPKWMLLARTLYNFKSPRVIAGFFVGGRGACWEGLPQRGPQRHEFWGTADEAELVPPEGSMNVSKTLVRACRPVERRGRCADPLSRRRSFCVVASLRDRARRGL